MSAPVALVVVDDSPEDRELYRRLLSQAGGPGYAISEADSGAEGLRLCEAERPDCVLLDYRLPDLDGLEFLTALAKEEGAFSAPVVVLTGQGSEGLVADVMKAGAADYLPKGSLSASALARAIMTAVERFRLQRAVERQHRLLGETNHQLQQRNAEIQSFYHTLSHEINTPLTAAREFVAIVLDGLAGEITETQREYLGIAKQSCDQMRRLINDLLDATRLETGKLSIEPRPTALSKLLRGAVASHAPLAEAGGLRLEHTIAPDVPAVLIDRQRIAQVLANLLSNAIKFTQNGGRIAVTAGQDPEQPCLARVSVSDTGRGIANEHLGSIFERLNQVRPDDAGSAGGLGLGLYLCRELIELHGGKIWADSQLGKGSTFSFTLPAWDPARETLPS